MSSLGKAASKLLPPAAALLLLGALPGEIRGCDTDLTDEVDHVEYCRDRCAVLCERTITCGIYVASGEPPEGGTIADLCQSDCEAEYGCRSPFLCPNADRYVSEREAETCLEAWSGLSCSTFERVPSCGSGFQYCPRPEACTGEVLCDPPEWE